MTADPLIAAARFLQSQLEWLRHAVADNGEPYAVAAFAEIDHCAAQLRGLVNGPAERKYLGPCGAELLIEGVVGPWPCEGDIYAPRGGTVGRCRTCGAEVAAADREAWLDGEVRAHAFRAVEISRAYPINIKTIRSWVLRGQLVEVSRDRDDKPLYNLGDALDLAAADAARRAGNQATRARRKDNAA